MPALQINIQITLTKCSHDVSQNRVKKPSDVSQFRSAKSTSRANLHKPPAELYTLSHYDGKYILKMRFTGEITKCNFIPECGSIRASNPELDYVGRVLIDFESKVIFVIRDSQDGLFLSGC